MCTGEVYVVCYGWGSNFRASWKGASLTFWGAQAATITRGQEDSQEAPSLYTPPAP